MKHTITPTVSEARRHALVVSIMQAGRYFADSGNYYAFYETVKDLVIAHDNGQGEIMDAIQRYATEVAMRTPVVMQIEKPTLPQSKAADWMPRDAIMLESQDAEGEPHAVVIRNVAEK
jgi:hypothetical protein